VRRVNLYELALLAGVLVAVQSSNVSYEQGELSLGYVGPAWILYVMLFEL